MGSLVSDLGIVLKFRHVSKMGFGPPMVLLFVGCQNRIWTPQPGYSPLGFHPTREPFVS